MTDLMALDACAQAALVHEGEMDPVELVDAAIDRVERLDPFLNAVIHRRFDRARDEAHEAPPGPFRGVPVLVKDLDGPLAGEPYHLGNRLLKEVGAVADHDSYLVAKLKAAGFVVIGKTNVPEFGLLPTTEPTAYGPTRNPWDLARSPGGSSGGSAAAVAARMVAVAHAGDGGGSIRIPASMCGLFGLKPTRGRVSLGPDEGEAWSGLVVRHALTRTVRDSAAVLDVLAGAMPGDPYSAPPPRRRFVDEVGTDPGRLRVGVRTAACAGLADVAPACRDAVGHVAAVLQDELGHAVEDAAPVDLDDVAALVAFTTIQSTAVAADVDRLAARAGREVTRADVEALTWELAERGRAISAAEYVQALERTRAWGRRLAAWWDDAGGAYDLLVTPTLAEPPPLLGEIAADGPAPEPALARIVPFGVFTVPFNLTGQPAASVPVWNGVQQYPLGVQLVAANGREDVLVRIASQLEQAMPWADRAPDVTDATQSNQASTER